MKMPALILTLCLGTAALAFAGDLADAAKGQKSKRQKSTSKVITNSDVKKSKGKISETPNVSTGPIVKEPTLTEKHDARRAAEKAAAERGAEHEKLVAQLEKELAAIEQQYYGENDLNHRDTVIAKKFNEVKAQLEELRNAAVPAAGPQASPD